MNAKIFTKTIYFFVLLLVCTSQANAQSQDTLQTRDTVQVGDTVQTRDTLQVSDTVQTRDTLQVGDTVQTRDNVQVGDTVQTRDTIQVGEPTYAGSRLNPFTINVSSMLGDTLIKDSVNTLNFQSLYRGTYAQSSPDVFYKITLRETYDVSIQTCVSSFDTYIHLLDSNQNHIASNDDNGPLCPSQNTRASMQRRLTPGVYHIVLEGYNQNTGISWINFEFETIDSSSYDTSAYDLGNITLRDSNNVQRDTIYKYSSVNTQGKTSTYVGVNAQSSPDVTYKMTLLDSLAVTFRTCNSNFDTYLHLLDANKNHLVSNDDNGPACDNQTQYNKASIKRNLSPGTYYLVMEGYSSMTGNAALEIIFERHNSNLREDADDNVASELTLSPNPASHNVHISTIYKGDTKLSVIDMQGKVQKELTVSGETDLDVTDLVKGLYIIQINQGDVRTIKRLEVL